MMIEDILITNYYCVQITWFSLSASITIQNSWEDETIGGLWKQSEASTSMNSDFIKISMYKLILLANSKAKSDYFLQQSKFVSNEGQKDAFAELSTKVEGELVEKKK